MPPRKSPGARRSRRQPLSVYQLRIELRRLGPAIWRRVQVLGDIALARMHTVIPRVMGWTNSHLHEFVVEGKRYGVPEREFETEDVGDEKLARLQILLRSVRRNFSYVYDFGDDWDHRITVEAILPADPAVRYPVLVDGKNACPPENVGGADGYCEFVAAVTNPAHKEHAEMLECCGGSFDPYAFDPEKTNALLAPLRR